jgi:hypothetical protein
VDVPVIWAVAAGQTPPRLCARHGEPAAQMRPVTFYRKAIPPWIWIGGVLIGLVLVCLLGLVIGPPLALVAGILLCRARPRVEVEAWPYCTRCVVLHRVCATGVAAKVAGFGAILLGELRWLDEGFDPPTVLAIAAGYLLGLAGLPGRRFSWRRLAGAQVSAEQDTLHVEAHGRFAADIRERLTAERASAAAA